MSSSNPYPKDARVDRAAHDGYSAAAQGQKLAPTEYADNGDLKMAWIIGNRRGHFDLNNA
ncbi:hypothetical protein [Noviherbaspirillum galbum]|uniref:Uncharacterized protein n=1 Tax=Noviherbaspirillum galbum TaxID=2709383 RepID=A0A6B3SHK9_9BURK|nr:hypothetical protein [Noviherbaspirillum galbum]NEX60158.1 hypothetical protein [Noviherbaspirillum galbum]